MASAEPGPRVALDYRRGVGTEQCPSTAQLAGDVAAHLGYGPFDDSAPERLRVVLQTTSTGTSALIELFDAAGRSQGRQRLEAKGPDCRELGQALSLAISLALDPVLGAEPQPPTRAVIVENADPAPAPPDLALESAQPAERPRLGAGVGLVGELGLAPAPALGLSVEAELRWKAFSLGVAGRGDLNAGEGFAGGTVRTALAAATVVPCALVGQFGGCVLAEAGVVEGSTSNLGDPSPTLTLHLAVGARAFWQLPLTQTFSLRPALEVIVPLVRTRLTVEGTEAWTTASVAGQLSVAGWALFP